MNYHNIKISVIIPVYNAEEYLYQCLDSVISQTYKNIEIIVVNDGSQGNCEQIIAEYCLKYNNIVYIRHEKNKSLLQARISGFKAATGDYVLCLDADDYISENLCRDCAQAIAKNPVDILQYKRLRVKNGENINCFANQDIDILLGENLIKGFTENKIFWIICGRLIKLDKIIKAVKSVDSGIYINMFEDLLLFSLILFNSSSYSASTKIGTYYYRYNENSMTEISTLLQDNTRSAKLCSNMRFVRAYILQYMENHKKLSEYREKIENVFMINFKYYSSFVSRLEEFKRDEFLWNLAQIVAPNHMLPFLGKKDFEVLSAIGRHSAALRHNQQKKIKKIGIIIHVHKQGVAARAAALLIAGLIQKGFLVHGFYYFEQLNVDYSIDIPYTILSAERNLRFSLLQKTIQEKSIDCCVFFDHYTIDGMYDILFAKSAGCYVVAVECNTFFFPTHYKHKQIYQSRNNSYACADAIVVLSLFDMQVWKLIGFHNVLHMEKPVNAELQASIMPEGKNVKNLDTFKNEYVIERWLQLFTALENNDSSIFQKTDNEKDYNILQFLNLMTRYNIKVDKVDYKKIIALAEKSSDLQDQDAKNIIIAAKQFFLGHAKYELS